jgi:hypothetical protein
MAGTTGHPHSFLKNHNCQRHTMAPSPHHKKSKICLPLIVVAGSLILQAMGVPVHAAQTITVDCSGTDASATQVAYLRGVARPFDLNNSPSVIMSNVETDINSGGLNFLNAVLDNLPDNNTTPDFGPGSDAGLFTYSGGNLAYSVSGNAPLVTTLTNLKNEAHLTLPKTMLQVSGLPYVFNDQADTNDELGCSANGNYYPLPSLTTMAQEQAAKENWISYLNSIYPNAIWIGTQEPSHTLGFSTAYDNGGCSNPTDMDQAIQTNINRFINYWTPIARYLRANDITSGGMQLNAGNSPYYVMAAQSIISAQMPLDYFTIQVYTPSTAVVQAAYQAYQTFQQNPNYQNVKVIIDRYGIQLNQPDWSSASNLISFLQDEAMLMPCASMMYGYALEQSALEGSGSYPRSNLPGVLRWLQNAPAPLRPLTSTSGDLQGIALVQNTAPKEAYVAVWNISPAGTTRSFSVDLNAFSSSLATTNLSITEGAGTNLTTISNSGITVTSGNLISGLSLKANEFLLITLTPPIQVSARRAGADFNLSWTGQFPPYVVQTAGLVTGPWTGALTTGVQSTSFPIGRANAFFRVTTW